MKYLLWTLILLICTACENEQQKNHEWISLFNGKDLSGWVVKINHHDFGENYGNTFRVEDGLLNPGQTLHQVVENANYAIGKKAIGNALEPLHCFAISAKRYALFNLEPRGRLFVVPGEPFYEGMIVGEHNRGQDIDVNPSKEKKLTNMRAAGKDDNVILSPIKPHTLEQAISFIREDELVEVTPQSVRMRKTVLSAQKRHTLRGAKVKDN